MSEDDAKKGFVFNKLGALFDKMFEKRNVLQRNALQTWRDETIMTKALQKREQRIKGDVVKAFKKNVDVKRDAKRRQIIPAFLDNIFGNNEEKKDLSYEQFYNMNKKKKEQESMTERMRIFSDKIREKLLEEKKEGSVIYSDDELEKKEKKNIDDNKNMIFSGPPKNGGGKIDGDDHLSKIQKQLGKTIVTPLSSDICTNNIMNSLGMESGVKRSRSLALALADPKAFLAERAKGESDILLGLQKETKKELDDLFSSNISQSQAVAEVSQLMTLRKDIMMKRLDDDYPLDFLNLTKAQSYDDSFKGANFAQPANPSLITKRKPRKAKKAAKKK